MNEVYSNRLTGSILESLREKVKAFNFMQFLKSKTDNFVDAEESELETTLYTTNNPDSYEEFEEEEELPDDSDVSEEELPADDSISEEELSNDSINGEEEEELSTDDSAMNEEELPIDVSVNEEELSEAILSENNEIKEDDYMSKAINKRKKDKKTARINKTKDTSNIEKGLETTVEDNSNIEKELETPVEDTSNDVEKELDNIVDKFNEEQIVITKPEEPDNSNEVSTEQASANEVSLEEPNNSNEVSTEEPASSNEVSILYLKECYDKCVSIVDIKDLNDKILKIYRDKFIITDNNVINIISTAYSTLDSITHSNNLQKVLMYLKQHYSLLEAMKKVSTESVDANKIMENFIKVLSKNTTQS